MAEHLFSTVGCLDFSHEYALQGAGYPRIAGVDEVGRGPWAGPVVAAAVVLDPHNLPWGANDSKKLTAKKREALHDRIWATAHVGIGEASVEEIDRHNILQATYMAMKRALAALPVLPDFALIDGNRLPASLSCPAHPVVKGDGVVLSIACASIVAKVYRDRLMGDLAKAHPHYGWEHNAGYGAPAHQQGLRTHGVTAHHRRSFKPIAELLQG